MMKPPVSIERACHLSPRAVSTGYTSTRSTSSVMSSASAPCTSACAGSSTSSSSAGGSAPPSQFASSWTIAPAFGSSKACAYSRMVEITSSISTYRPVLSTLKPRMSDIAHPEHTGSRTEFLAPGLVHHLHVGRHVLGEDLASPVVHDQRGLRRNVTGAGLELARLVATVAEHDHRLMPPHVLTDRLRTAVDVELHESRNVPVRLAYVIGAKEHAALLCLGSQVQGEAPVESSQLDDH